MRKNSKLLVVLVILLVLICLAPFCYVVLRSFLKPDIGVTFRYYYDVFIAQSQYLDRFWRSLFLGGGIAVGQMIVSVLAGYGFAKCRFPGKNVLFFGLIVLMIMPLQVTMTANYIVLNKMKLLDTYLSLLLPAVFVPLGAFIMTQSFRAIPTETVEAAKLDGAGTFRILTRIAVPMSRSGLVCTMLLSFLDGWNMVEQPIVYLRDFADYPLAVALASTPAEEPTVQLVCCILTAIPPVLLFAWFNRELVEGIALVKEK